MVYMIYLLLSLSILLEVIGTSLLKATNNFSKPLPSLGVFISYGIAFYLMSIVMKELPVGIVYAVWSGCGIVLVSLVSYFAYKQSLDLAAIVGIGLIIAGVIVINVFSKSISH